MAESLAENCASVPRSEEERQRTKTGVEWERKNRVKDPSFL